MEIGVTGLTIARWESGHTPANEDHLRRYVELLEALGASCEVGVA